MRDPTSRREPPVPDTVLRVLVIDDDPHVRTALREIIDHAPDLSWVTEAVDAAEAVSACVAHQPDVALLDVRIPGGGAAAARDITSHCPEVGIVALSSFADTRHRELMRAAGAVAYVVKGAPVEQLLDTIRTVGARSR